MTTHSESFGFTTLTAGGTAGSNPSDRPTIPVILCGSGVPTVVAPKGSFYLRSDGAPYIATDAVGGWASAAGADALPQPLDVTDSPTFDALTLTTGPLTVGAAALTEAELETLDGITPGTALASKALILGASKEIATITSATITTLTATNEILGGYQEITEIADPAAPAANKCRLYARDTGGKTELVAVFNSGAVQQVAIEP